jgi:signal transduction histidine kinase
VCLNLLDNARKAVGGNARISLKGHPVERGYQFIIEDNGCGMETNELSKIKEA